MKNNKLLIGSIAFAISSLLFLLFLIFIFSSIDKANNEFIQQNLEKNNIEGYIQYCVINSMGDKTNTNPVKQKLISVEKISDKNYNVKINANEGWNDDTAKNKMLIDTKNFYKEFIKQTNRINEIDNITLIYYQTLINKYGKTSENAVIKIAFNKETILKINWENVLTDKLPEISDEYWTHNIYK